MVEGRHRRGADALLARYERAPAPTLLTAAHGLIEAISAIRRLARGGGLSADEGLAAVEWLGEIDLSLDATAPRIRRIWTLRDRMSAYDAAYAATAEAFGTPLLTTDDRLRRACDGAGIPAAHLDEIAGAA